MSSQPTQRPRRNNSPSITKQGPIKATLQFSLRQGSPTLRSGRKSSPSSSPTPWANDPYRTKTRRSPDNRTSPERRSPTSPGHKVERPKPVKVGSPVGSSQIRRTNSLDTITAPYLSGQWPRDPHPFQYTANNSGNFPLDKFTQTPDEWDDYSPDKKKNRHKRSASLGNGDLKELYKQRQRQRKPGASQPRQSPVPGNHAAFTAPLPHTPSKPVGIPLGPQHIPKQRTRGSLEGLNQEIESLVLQRQNAANSDELDRTREVTPDGHRAPIAEQLIRGSSTRSVDTQTPSAFNCDDSASSSGGNSRSQSISPSFPMIAGEMDKPCATVDSEGKTDAKLNKVELEEPSENQASKHAASPRPNKSYNFVRGPPDGAEKVKVIDEKYSIRRAQSLVTPVFVLTPSAGSAFDKCVNLYSPHFQTTVDVVPALKSPVASSQASSQTVDTAL